MKPVKVLKECGYEGLEYVVANMTITELLEDAPSGIMEEDAQATIEYSRHRVAEIAECIAESLPDIIRILTSLRTEVAFLDNKPSYCQDRVWNSLHTCVGKLLDAQGDLYTFARKKREGSIF